MKRETPPNHTSEFSWIPKNLSEAKVAIWGIGLMGGSLAMTLHGKTTSLFGIDADAQVCHLAQDLGIFDRISTHPSDLLPLANVVILSAPLGILPTLLEELPELQGSEKQIAWATTIRHKLLNNIQLAYENKAEKFYFAWSAIESLLGKDMLNQLDNEFASLGLNTFSERYNHKQEFLVQFLNSDRMLRALDSLQSKTSANWWIDNRDTRASALLVAEYNATEPTLDDTPTKIVADVKAEATVRPESPLTETVAEIHLAGHEVQVSFKEKVEDFRLLMHKLQFKWMHSYWGRSLSGNNGLPDDRIAEAGNAILNAGFIIRLFDPELRRRAIAAEFELEHTRWILRVTSGEYIGWFEIKWSREEDYYKVAKKLPRSRYSKPYVVVPPESFEEVLDFAQPLRHSLADCLTINQGSFFERILYLSRLVRLKTM